MKKYKLPFLKSLCFIISLFFISSCLPLLIGGGGVAAVTGGKLIAQEKTVGESFSDTTIWTKIKAKLANRGIDRIVMGSINIEVNEGRVLLTGTVADKNKIITILKVCWSVNGVKEVINELQITDKKNNNVFAKASDAWITTKIKSKFLASKQIFSVNYTVETIEGIVYLFGVSQSQTELDEAIDIVSATDGVKKIISYVRVKKDISKKLSETKGGQKSISTKKKEKKLMDYDFDYSDIHSLEEDELEKPTIIKPKKLEPESKKDKNDVFEDDDF